MPNGCLIREIQLKLSRCPAKLVVVRAQLPLPFPNSRHKFDQSAVASAHSACNPPSLTFRNMLDILHAVEKSLPELLQTQPLHSMYIDYHPPCVSRIWFQHGEYRVYLHKIEPCTASHDALYHPHPWQSAIRIVQGQYEMGVGHSATDVVPVTDCKLILQAGTEYEMLEENAWHYVNPLGAPSYSLMVTGKLSQRKMPLEPKRQFRPLTSGEAADLLQCFSSYYKLDMEAELQQLIAKFAG